MRLSFFVNRNKEPDGPLSMKEILKRNLAEVNKRIASAAKRSGRDIGQIRLIAVTKNHPVETVQTLIELGVKEFGESRSKEIEQKFPQLHGEFSIHMIGHLQTNKVTHVLPFVKWIQSVDRMNLIERIEKLHTGSHKIKALVEVNTSGDLNKSGCSAHECRALCERVTQSKALEFCGLMTIGPLGADEKKTRESFMMLRELGRTCNDLVEKVELSMGMSLDFEWAIEEGSTMVRIGTLLVGERV